MERNFQETAVPIGKISDGVPLVKPSSPVVKPSNPGLGGAAASVSFHRELTYVDDAYTPVELNADDRLDEQALRINKHRKCCKSKFIRRLWNRLKMDHIVIDTAPFFILLKSALVCLIAILIDKGEIFFFFVYVCVRFFSNDISKNAL
jgi:hypothetical protein